MAGSEGVTVGVSNSRTSVSSKGACAGLYNLCIQTRKKQKRSVLAVAAAVMNAGCAWEEKRLCEKGNGI
jgi:hypothetical protein